MCVDWLASKAGQLESRISCLQTWDKVDQSNNLVISQVGRVGLLTTVAANIDSILTIGLVPPGREGGALHQMTRRKQVGQKGLRE